MESIFNMTEKVMKRTYIPEEDEPTFAHEILQGKTTRHYEPVKREPRLVDGKINIASGEDAHVFNERS